MCLNCIYHKPATYFGMKIENGLQNLVEKGKENVGGGGLNCICLNVTCTHKTVWIVYYISVYIDAVEAHVIAVSLGGK